MNDEQQQIENNDEEIMLLKDIASLAEYSEGDKYETGIKLFDDALDGGFEDGDLIIISGASGFGKTTFSQMLAINFAEKGLPVLFLSYEVMVHHLWKKFKTMHINEELPLFSIKRHTTGNVGWIEQKIKEAKEANLIKFVVIDHLGFLIPKQRTENIGSNQAAFVSQIVRELKTLAKNERVVIILPVHVRKTDDPGMNDLKDCLDENQLIFTTSGKRVKIKDIVKGENIMSKRSLNRLQNDNVKDVWKTGEKDIYEVTTKTGRKIRCSDGHKFFATTFNKSSSFGPGQGCGIKGWTELKNLSIGQKIAVVKRYNLENTSQEITKEQAIILGWLVGDGNISTYYNSSITVNKKEEVDLLGIIAKKAFNLSTYYKKYKNADAYNVYMSSYRHGKGVKKKSNELSCFLRENNIKYTGKDKRVPDIIFTQPNNIIGGFLSGLFHADGSISIKKNSNSACLSLTTISETLAYDVQHLLLRFGIISSVNKNNNHLYGSKKENGFIYKVNLSGHYLKRFVSEIGFFLSKQDKALSIANTIVPKSKDKDSDIFFDRIIKIEHIGRGMTYDLEVVGKHSSLENHSFCVQDFITHNSSAISQESDAVFILNREKNPLEGVGDYYTDHTLIKMVKNRKTGMNAQGWFQMINGRFVHDNQYVPMPKPQRSIMTF